MSFNSRPSGFYYKHHNSRGNRPPNPAGSYPHNNNNIGAQGFVLYQANEEASTQMPPRQQPQPISRKGMTFIPTHSATNFTEHSGHGMEVPNSGGPPQEMGPGAAGFHPPPVCPFYLQGDCWSVGPHCRHGVHPHLPAPMASSHHHQGCYLQQQQFLPAPPPTGRGIQPSTQQQQHQNVAPKQQPRPEARGVVATDDLKPSNLSAGNWTNERRVRGAAAPSPARALAGVDDNQEDAGSALSSTASSVDLNDTFTRDPWEAEEKRKALHAVRRSQRSTPVPAQEQQEEDPWATWTVESSSRSRSPINDAPSAPPKQGLWAYEVPGANPSATSGAVSSASLSLKNSPLMSLMAPPPFAMPQPIAPTPSVIPPPAIDSFQLPAAATIATSATSDECDLGAAPPPVAPTAPPPADTTTPAPKKISYRAALGGGGKDGRSPLQQFLDHEPPTKPSSAVQTPSHRSRSNSITPGFLKPGAVTVEDLESALHSIAEKDKSATNSGDAGADSEAKFKVHRYRGPRHCRACRFHSKSLHSQVVLSRDLNLRYKLDMFCKVCDETFEECVDDKEWQVCWERHCKTQRHYRNSLEESPSPASNGIKGTKAGATPPVPSRNGGASFNKNTTVAPTPDRKVEGAPNLAEPATTARPARATNETEEEGEGEGRKTVTTLFHQSSDPSRNRGSSPGITSSFIVQSDPVAGPVTVAKSGLPFQNRAVKKPQHLSLEEDEEEEVLFMPAW